MKLMSLRMPLHQAMKMGPFPNRLIPWQRIRLVCRTIHLNFQKKCPNPSKILWLNPIPPRSIDTMTRQDPTPS